MDSTDKDTKIQECQSFERNAIAIDGDDGSDKNLVIELIGSVNGTQQY